MKLKELSLRQKLILELIEENLNLSQGDLLNYLKKKEIQISKITLIRDLNDLLKNKFIRREGNGRGTRYGTLHGNIHFKFIDIEKYFQKGQDERDLKFPNFNFEIFNQLQYFFTTNDLRRLINLNSKYISGGKKLSEKSIQENIKNITIEFAWKSSQIEGNTYNLIDTEFLIKNNIEAKGHTKDEARMILNHRDALSFVYDNKKLFKNINLGLIEKIHLILIKDLGIESGFRRTPVKILGTNFKPIDNEFQIKEAVGNLCSLINKTDDIFAKAFIALVIIAYIQPFADGNKRTSRLLCNAILISTGFCPLSFRSIDEAEYKKAIILFYEENNLRYLKELFLEQIEFAVENYFN